MGQILVGVAGILIHQTIHHTTLQQVLGDNLLHVGLFHTAVEGAVGIHDNHRTQGAQTETTGLNHLDFAAQLVLLNALVEGFDDFITTRGGTAGTATDHNVSSNHC